MQRQQSLDVNVIRDIAAQAGISPASVDKALEEHQVSPTSLRARLMRRPGLMVGTVILAVYLLLRLME